jgi:phosphonate transport system ATP-binding protein
MGSRPATIPDERLSPAAPPGPDLRLIGAVRRFGAFEAVAGVSLAVGRGERIAVLGPSGAGKSTLLRLVNTSLAASSGTVQVLGQDPSALPATRLRRLRSRIGTIYQQLNLVPQASVLENVLMGRLGTRSALAVAAGAVRRRDRAEVAAILAQVGLAGLLDQRVDRLSGGEQQRVAVARVLYQAPDVVVADEPFSAVDPERSHAVVTLLVQAAEGRTLVLSTHQLEPVLPHFPRLVGLRAGRILFDKRRDDVTRDDLALLYQPEEATRSPEPRRVLAPRQPSPAGVPGELRIGASTTPGEHLLPPAVASFARAHPETQLRLLVKDTGAVLDALAGGAVELAFVGARHPGPDLHFEDWAEDEIVLVAAPSFGGLPDPLPASLAARLPRVDREPGSATREVVEAQLAGMGVALDPASSVLEAGSVAALVGAVAAGMGVGFASRRSVAPALAAGRLREVRIDAVKVPRRFYVAWRRDRPLSGAARAFLELARRAPTGPPP